MQYCNLHDRSNGLFLGYFSLLTEVLSKYPEGVPEGSYFVNGETLSIWVWNDAEKEWMDTNRPMQSPLSGVVDDPATYRPEVVKGVKAYYLYISPPVENLSFVHFVNGDEPLRITVETSAVVSLFWDGDFWHVYSTPVKLEAFQAESYTDFRFQLSASEDTPPKVNRLSINPGEGWASQIPESGEGLFLWMISAKLDGNGDFCDAEVGWSAPVRLTGDKGSTGPNGENSYCMVLSNDSHTIPCQQDGTGGYYDGAHTTCYVFEGSVDISSQYTFNVIVPDGVVYTLGNQNRTVVVSGMEGDSATITFIGECLDKPTLIKVFSLAKSKQGFDGDPAVTYRLSVSDIVVRQTSDGWRLPEQLTVEALVQTAGEIPSLFPAYFLVEGIKKDASRTTLLSATSPVSSVSFPTLAEYVSFEITLYKDYTAESGFQNRLDHENIPVLCDGADGEGKVGAVLRPRGEWRENNIYGCFESYRDVVIYGEDRRYYVAKEGIGSIPVGTLPTNTIYWEPFDDYENIATGLLLADNAYIDILGTSGIRIGNYPNCWEMTSGAITHRVSGLSLTADGVLSDPDGLHIKIGDNTVVDFTQNKIQTSVTEEVSKIEIGGRNLAINSDFSKGGEGWYMYRSSNNLTVEDNVATISGNRDEIIACSPVDIVAGEVYTVSAEVRSDNLTSLNYNYILGRDLGGVNEGLTYNGPAAVKPSISSEWSKVAVTFIPRYTQKAGVGFGFNMPEVGAYSFQLRKFKLEKGNKATDWTPAPEDTKNYTDDAISNLQFGGRNLILDSAEAVLEARDHKNNNYTFSLSSKLKPGTNYVVSVGRSVITTGTAASEFTVRVFDSTIAGTPGIKNEFSLPISEERQIAGFMTPSDLDNTHKIDFIFYAGLANNTTNRGMIFYEVKLEEGNKATDWSPAPEDVQAELDDKVATTVYETGITQLSDQISLKASQTDLNALGNRVSATESEILLMPDKITLEVSKVQIGARNLVLKSDQIFTARISTKTYDMSKTWLSLKGKTVAISFDYSYTNATTDSSNHRLWFEQALYTDTGVSYALSRGISLPITSTPISGSGRYTGTAVVPSNIISTSTTKVSMLIIKMTGGSGTITNFKIEEGTKATDWTPAPEDVPDSLLRTGIDIEAGTITLDAAKTVVTGELIVKGIQNGGINVGGNCIITSTGLITAKGATIEGKITATSGSIGGVSISNSRIGIDSSSTTAVGSFFAAEYLGVRNMANYFRVDANETALQCTINKQSDTTPCIDIKNTSTSGGSTAATAIRAFGKNELYGGVQIISGGAVITDDSVPKIEVTSSDLKVTLRYNNTGTYVTGYLRITSEPSGSGGTANVQFVKD